MITLKKGFTIPITGAPSQDIGSAGAPSMVALLGIDYHGLKPSMTVTEGDRVQCGQPLFEDKKNPGVIFTAPASGTITEINRGQRRSFQSLVIEVDNTEQVVFSSYTAKEPGSLNRQAVVDLLVESGLWTAIRTRPYSKIPAPDSTPHAVFVTAMDTNPLAPCVETILAQKPEAFETGLSVLATLTDGSLYLCKAPASNLPGLRLPCVTVSEFSGPHPAGLVGTHIHFLDPVNQQKTVWHIGYQDVVAVGHLFLTGKLYQDRFISLAGPQVKKPQIIKTVLGANLDELTSGKLCEGQNRIISGSVLSGTTAHGPFTYLGRYHNQVSVISEGGQQEFLGWLAPGSNKFSIKPMFLSALSPKKLFSFTTALNGSQRAIVPIGSFEKVMPLDIEPTYLLRAIAVRDVEQAEALGCLELDEEDLALCTFVDSSKNSYAPLLRETLTMIEKEG
nr:Na(+)-translocating NADH-quinone reductase subunit A [Desulfobulbaceae bacterium]